MRTLPNTLFRYCTIAVCAVVVANGCMLNRAPIVASAGRVEPAQYCPGDTLTASYDFLRFTHDGICVPRDGVAMDCERSAPNVTISSSPALFPSVTLRSYVNRVDFPASGDRVDVSFAYGNTNVFIPPTTMLQNVLDNTVTATRIIGALETSLPHMGNCAAGFAVPTYAGVEVGSTPAISPNLGLVGICNPASNGVSVNYTLVGAAPGEAYTLTLAPGSCQSTSAPGVPAFAATAQRIDAAPIALMCGPGGNGVTSPQPIAPPLSTLIQRACH
jgi:hypothetical protein